jgi:hypothetical protein
VEFASPLSHDEKRLDAYYDGEPLRYHTMEDLLGDQPVSGLVSHDLEAQLHLACDDGEPRSFEEAERDTAWRAAMQLEMDVVSGGASHSREPGQSLAAKRIGKPLLKQIGSKSLS